MKTQPGFTMIEALIVVLILAILATLAIPTFQGSVARGNVRKTIDLIAATLVMAQSEALKQNVTLYVTLVSGNLCIGTTTSACDVRRQSLISGVSVTAPNLSLSPFYGTPSPYPATFIATYSGVTQSLTMNKLGIITVNRTP